MHVADAVSAILLANSSITPNTVTFISIIPILLGFTAMWLGDSKGTLLFGWLMFFLWNLLDGVDGNLARYRKQFSKDGSAVDAMAGYAAMALTFLAAGIAASHGEDMFNLSSENYIILGALSSIALIFPRLVMHKYINSVGEDSKSEALNDKKSYGLLKILILNLTSITGLPQVLLLIAIVFNLLDIYTLVYFAINSILMVASIYALFRNKGK